MDLIFLFFLCFYISSTVRAKGRRRVGYVVLLLGSWVIGVASSEIVLFSCLTIWPGQPTSLGVAIFAYGGGGVGTAIALLIIKNADHKIQSSGDHDYDNPDWQDSDYARRFGDVDVKQDDVTTNSSEHLRREDDRFKTE